MNPSSLTPNVSPSPCYELGNQLCMCDAILRAKRQFPPVLLGICLSCPCRKCVVEGATSPVAALAAGGFAFIAPMVCNRPSHPMACPCIGNGLDESWRKYSGAVRKYMSLYVRLLAENGDSATLAAACAYLHTRTSWAFNVMPDLARCACMYLTSFKSALLQDVDAILRKAWHDAYRSVASGLQGLRPYPCLVLGFLSCSCAHEAAV